MKYIITVRPLTKSDVSFDCPYGSLALDLEDYELHVKSLASDIANLKGVNSVLDTNNQICVDTVLSKDDLLEKMKPFFSREFCYLRYLSLT